MTGKLTALAVTRAKERGTYGDGGGLYLQVARGGTKSWILRYKRAGKTRHLGLGPLAVVSLREASERPRTRDAVSLFVVHNGSMSASRPFWIGPRFAAIATAKIRRA
jgi:hypothetical protein